MTAFIRETTLAILFACGTIGAGAAAGLAVMPAYAAILGGI
jgi:hypothetical protein